MQRSSRAILYGVALLVVAIALLALLVLALNAPHRTPIQLHPLYCNEVHYQSCYPYPQQV